MAPSGLGDLLASETAGAARAAPVPPDGAQPLPASAPLAAVAGETAALAPIDPQPHQQLPPDMAKLTVVASDGDHVRLIGRCVVEDLEDEQPLEERRRPDLSLANIRPGGTNPAQALNRMYAWSRGARTLVTWLAGLHARLGDELNLVIEDATGFEIPWELVSIPVGEGRETAYLGAAVTVVRCPVRTLASADVRSTLYSESELECAGGVAGYLSDELRNVDADDESLQRLGARLFRDVPEFQEFLDSDPGDYALVYFGCHGVLAAGLDAALGSSRDADQQLVLGTLERLGVPLVQRCRSAVVLNACHSGQLAEDRYVADGLFYGFPALFLGQGAAGVIGTAGEVPDRAAAEVARTLLGAMAVPGVPLATQLRQLRRAVAERHRRREAVDDELVATFLYLYFGSPRCTVRIG